MIAALHGFIGKPSSGGGTPVFVQSAKVMFTADGAFRTDTNWNTIDQNTTNGALVNQLGASIGWKITVPSSDDWDIDANASNSGFGDFTSVALERAVYTVGSGTSKTITYSSLDTTKSYKVRVASLQGYDDPAGDNKADVTVNGVAKQLLNALGFTPYEQDFDLITGVSSLSVTVGTAAGATYALFCAIILEEYSTT